MSKVGNSSGALAQSDRSEDTVLTGYVTPCQLAAELGVSLRTLQRWHGLRCGPPRVTVGRTILYNVAAVRRWLENHEVEPKRGVGKAGPRND